MSAHSQMVSRVKRYAKLTDKQAAFVRYVCEGVTLEMSAELAGYSMQPGVLSSIFQSQNVVAALEHERRKRYRADLPFLAVTTIREILKDKKAPAAARVNAAKVALTLAGDLGQPQEDDPAKRGDLAEYSADDLRMVIARSRAIVEAADAQQIEGVAVEVTPPQPDADAQRLAALCA